MSATADKTLEQLLRDAPLPLVAARILRARKALELSHDQLGERMGGVFRQTLIRLEKGRNRPRIETLIRIAEATGRDPRWFVDPEVDPSPFQEENAA